MLHKHARTVNAKYTYGVSNSNKEKAVRKNNKQIKTPPPETMNQVNGNLKLFIGHSFWI